MQNFTAHWVESRVAAQQVSEFEDRQTANRKEVFALVNSELTALSEASSAEVTHIWSGSCVNVLMLTIVLPRRQNFVANLTLELVEIWMLVDHMSAAVVLRGIDPSTAGKSATESSVLHIIIDIDVSRRRASMGERMVDLAMGSKSRKG